MNDMAVWIKLSDMKFDDAKLSRSLKIRKTVRTEDHLKI